MADNSPSFLTEVFFAIFHAIIFGAGLEIFTACLNYWLDGPRQRRVDFADQEITILVQQ